VALPLVLSRLAGGLLAACDRFNAAHPWDHNAHYHRAILRRLPRRIGAALDVGCGSGELVALLAARSDTVLGVDRDAVLIGHARTTRLPNAGYLIGDALALPPDGRYQVVTCLAALHHLPLAEALARFRGWLAPGGTLVVLGCYQEETRSDRLLGALALPANLAVGLVRGSRRGRPVAMTAPTRPAFTTLAHLRAQVALALPGARIRRHLFWRYTLVYRNS
jgi:trans-aconitate methyltransferase